MNKVTIKHFSGDIFNPKIYLVDSTGVYPSTIKIFLPSYKGIDLDKLTPDCINRHFPEIDSWGSYEFSHFDYLDTSFVNESQRKRELENRENSEEYSFSFSDSQSDKRFWYSDNVVIELGPFMVVVHYNPKAYTQIALQKQLETFINSLPFRAPKLKESSVKLVGYSDGDFYTMDSSIRPVSLEINKFYNDDFLPEYKKLLDFLEQKESGLALLRGEVGTGKTNLLRYLITSRPADYIFITPSISSYLGNPEFVGFLQSNKNSIFILEDCEQILRDRSENSFGTSIANILNMTDGILSDIFNIKFICTFNAPETTIDPALLREGRCFCNYEFKKLVANKCAKLNKEYSLNIPDSEITDMTLAELFNYKEKKQKATRKIGF